MNLRFSVEQCHSAGLEMILTISLLCFCILLFMMLKELLIDHRDKWMGASYESKTWHSIGFYVFIFLMIILVMIPINEFENAVWVYIFFGVFLVFYFVIESKKKIVISKNTFVA